MLPRLVYRGLKTQFNRCKLYSLHIFGTILTVTNDRVIDTGQMLSDLVFPTRFNAHFNQTGVCIKVDRFYG